MVEHEGGRVVVASVLEWKKDDIEEMIRSWKAKDGEQFQTKTTKLDKI